jgi:hypothetical protein
LWDFDGLAVACMDGNVGALARRMLRETERKQT